MQQTDMILIFSISKWYLQNYLLEFVFMQKITFATPNTRQFIFIYLKEIYPIFAYLSSLFNFNVDGDLKLVLNVYHCHTFLYGATDQKNLTFER